MGVVSPAMSRRFSSFSEFYPFYLSEHSLPECRLLHFVGSLGVIGCVVMAVVSGPLPWLAIAPICGYGFAWIGHFGFEKNKPASFKWPLYSLMGDWVMFKDILAGKISIRPGSAEGRAR